LLNSERTRQQTVRLEWYRDILKPQLEGIHQAFSQVAQLRSKINTSDLSELEKDRILVEYKKMIFEVRDKYFEPILFVHPPTYQKLKNELDNLADNITNAIVNDELKLSHDSVYEREVGSKIKECQQSIYHIIYGYNGEK